MNKLEKIEKSTSNVSQAFDVITHMFNSQFESLQEFVLENLKEVAAQLSIFRQLENLSLWGYLSFGTLIFNVVYYFLQKLLFYELSKETGKLL